MLTLVIDTAKIQQENQKSIFSNFEMAFLEISSSESSSYAVDACYKCGFYFLYLGPIPKTSTLPLS
jgi:hypothetical protein